MLQIVMLCGMMNGGIACLPFPTLEHCIAASTFISYDYIRDVKCTSVHMRSYKDPAPDVSPVPPARPRIHRTEKWAML